MTLSHTPIIDHDTLIAGIERGRVLRNKALRQSIRAGTTAFANAPRETIKLTNGLLGKGRSRGSTPEQPAGQRYPA